jgi:hypothetical protein
MAELSRDEFENWMRVLREDIQGVHERLDGLNGRTRRVENKVSVLEDRASAGRKEGAVAGGIAAVVVGAAELVRQWVIR